MNVKQSAIDTFTLAADVKMIIYHRMAVNASNT